MKRGVDYPAQVAAERRQLVRPLGRELHLRHLVGAGGLERRRLSIRRRPDDPHAPPIGWSRSRTRTAAGARAATATSSTTRATSQRLDRVADGLGVARLDGGGRESIIPPSRAASAICKATQQDDGLWPAGHLHRRRFPARVLSALPRLPEVLPALGGGALPQSDRRQLAASVAYRLVSVIRDRRGVISAVEARECRSARRTVSGDSPAAAYASSAANAAHRRGAGAKRAVSGIISIGIAGALSPDLKPGRLRGRRARS